MKRETHYGGRPAVLTFIPLLSAGMFFVLVQQSPAEDNSATNDPAMGPSRGDSSAFVPLSYDELPKDLAPADEGTYEGGRTGTAADPAEDNVIPKDAQQDNGTFDVPTNGAPSPLFVAQPFS